MWPSLCRVLDLFTIEFFCVDIEQCRHTHGFYFEKSIENKKCEEFYRLLLCTNYKIRVFWWKVYNTVVHRLWWILFLSKTFVNWRKISVPMPKAIAKEWRKESLAGEVCLVTLGKCRCFMLSSYPLFFFFEGGERQLKKSKYLSCFCFFPSKTKTSIRTAKGMY